MITLLILAGIIYLILKLIIGNKDGGEQKK